MLEYLWWLAEGCVLSGQSQVNWQVEFILRFLKEYHCTSLLCAVLATVLRWWIWIRVIIVKLIKLSAT